MHSQVSSVSLDGGEAALVIASDGLWGVLTDDEAAEVAASSADGPSAAAALVGEATKRGSRDNVSAIVVKWPAGGATAG